MAPNRIYNKISDKNLTNEKSWFKCMPFANISNADLIDLYGNSRDYWREKSSNNDLVS